MRSVPCTRCCLYKKQSSYNQRKKTLISTYTMDSAYECETLLGRMRNVPSDRPCSRRSASERLQLMSQVFSSRCGSGASEAPATPLLLCSIRLSRLWLLSPRSKSHLMTPIQCSHKDYFITHLHITCKTYNKNRHLLPNMTIIFQQTGLLWLIDIQWRPPPSWLLSLFS